MIFHHILQPWFPAKNALQLIGANNGSKHNES